MGILSIEDLSTILIFEEISADWVREVHSFTFKRKKKKKKQKRHFVLFRNPNNRKLYSLKDLQSEGVEVDKISFRSAKEHKVVSNKVGANKIARKAAKAWSTKQKVEEGAHVTPEGEAKAEAADTAVEAKEVEAVQVAMILVDLEVEAEAAAETGTAPFEAEVLATDVETTPAVEVEAVLPDDTSAAETAPVAEVEEVTIGAKKNR